MFLFLGVSSFFYVCNSVRHRKGIDTYAYKRCNRKQRNKRGGAGTANI